MSTPGEPSKSELHDLFARLGRAQDRALMTAPAATPPVAARRGPRRRFARAAAVVTALTVAATTSVLIVRSRTSGPQAASTRALLTAHAGAGEPLAIEAMVAAGDSELPLRFSDGSMALFHPGSTGRLVHLQDTGAEVELIAGRIEASIIHGQGAHWVFRAGPFAVRVTGTRFDIEWSPATRRLVVSLRQGGVTVDGAILGAGVPLRAGQRLVVALGEGADGLPEGSVRTEALPVAPPPSVSGDSVVETSDRSASARAVSASARAGHRADGREADDWMTLADRGAQAEAWQAARRIGVEDLRQRLDPTRLLALADVARYAGARTEAREIFLALVTRFPRHRLTSDAVFSLGRLAFEAGDPAAATSWFARYQSQWPQGALASEATGRLIEAAVARQDDAGAKSAAQRYLDRAPQGSYAPLARQILAPPSSGGAAAGSAR
jgi:transmembrane sensor